MKKSKKIIALVLAMVMLFALTASALAVTNSTITVKVTVRSILAAPTTSNPDATETTVLCSNQTFNITSGSSVFDLVQTMSNTDFVHAHNAAWRDVDVLDSNNQPTSETGKVLVSLSNTTVSEVMGNTITKEKVWGNVSQNDIMVSSDMFAKYTHGEYEGTEWVYTVNGEDPEVYMNHCTLNNNDEVVLTYQYSKFSWDKTEPNSQ